MTPKVSVIVPIYNVEQFLDRCVQSLLKQTLKEIEIILVDDESPDNCPQMCDEYARHDERIKVVHKKNSGLGMACNSGMEIATGEYIAFCDSDDYVDAHMYERMYQASVEHQAEVIFTGINFVNSHGNVKLLSKEPKEQLLSDKNSIHSYLLDMIASKPSDTIDRKVQMSAKIVLYQRQLIEKYHLRFESERQFISEDLIWNIDVLSHATRVYLIPEAFYFYCFNISSLTQKVRTDRFTFAKVLRKEVINRCQKYGVNNNVKFRVDRMFIGYMRNDMKKVFNNKAVNRPELKSYYSEILDDHIWKDIASYYPVSEMPIKHRIIFFLILHKFRFLLKLLFKVSK